MFFLASTTSKRLLRYVFMDCFDAGMISIILTVIFYSNLRHAISNVNKVVIKQIGNFLFVTNNPVISFQDNVIGLLTFSMQKTGGK